MLSNTVLVTSFFHNSFSLLDFSTRVYCTNTNTFLVMTEFDINNIHNVLKRAGLLPFASLKSF